MNQNIKEFSIASMQTPPSIIIGIAGGSASGKSTFARSIAIASGSGQAITLAMDRFYRPLGPSDSESEFNFDEPSALDFTLIESVINDLSQKGYAQAPVYDFATHDRIGYETIPAAPLVIVEGLLVLWHEPLREMFDFKIFVDVPDDLRFKRRMHRDVRERGRVPISVERQWAKTVIPMHKRYVEPTKHHADQIVNGRGDLAEVAKHVCRELSR